MTLSYYKPKVVLRWVTPNGDQTIADLARVSVKDGDGKPVYKLISYMEREGHASPFDMANMCVEIHAPRDISRQIIRHWSIKPQEFSQRYAIVDDDMFVLREARRQHPTNRQMSVDTNDDDYNLKAWWESVQVKHIRDTQIYYQRALDAGIAREQARVLLPEGNTMSKLYMNGTVRSWIHYLRARQNIDTTQREHVWVADEIAKLFAVHFPTVHRAFFAPEVVYAVQHTGSGVIMGTVRDRDDLLALLNRDRHEVTVVSFQPNLEWARVTWKELGGLSVIWQDYRLIPQEPENQ